MRPMTVFFMGTQGAGKGTQAGLLAKYLRQKNTFPVAYFTIGSHYRGLQHKDTFSASVVYESINRGELQPDFMSIYLWSDFFMNTVPSFDSHFVVEGVPRSLRQAELLDETMCFYKHERPVVIHLSLPEAVAVERLVKRGRNDDTKEAITKRMRWSEEQTFPALMFYRNHERYTVVDVDGDRTVEEIHEDIIEKLEQRYQ